MSEIEKERIDDVGQVLLDAADALERYGWVRGRMGNTAVGFCATGAVYHAVGRSESDGRYRSALRRLSKFLGGGGVAGWNDRTIRNREEVTAALRGAAELRDVN